MSKLIAFLKKNPFIPIGFIAILLCVGLLFLSPHPVKYDNPDPENIRTNIRFFNNIGGDFTLLNQEGKKVSLSDYAGKPTLLYFGFTHCPDFCPTALHLFDAVDSDLGGDKINRIFVSVDPQRDTVDALKEYANLYQKGLILLTGTTQEVDAVAKKWKVFYTLNKKDPSDTDYAVDHMTYSFLLDSKGQLVAMLEADTPLNMITDFIKTNHLVNAER